MEFEIWQYAVFFITALIGGFVDAIAGGGGIIAVPVLMAMGIPPHAALATNKLQGSFGSFTAALNFALKGLVNFKEIFSGIIFTFIGACVGTYLVLQIDTKFLNYLVPAMLAGIFIYTILSPKIGEEEKKAKISSRFFYIIFGLVLGFYDGFFGPGTGSFWTFTLVGFLGLYMKKAVAHTKVLNFTSNIVSLGVFVYGGSILWTVGLIMGIGQVIGGYLGSNMVIKKDIKFIKTMFLIVVGVTILKILYDMFLK